VKAGTLRRPKWLTERGALHWKSTVATLRDLRLDAEPYSLAAGLLANQLGWYAYTTSPQAMEDLGDALAIREQGKAFDRLVKIGRELGLSPTSIASAQSPAKEQPKNGLDALILRENEGQLKIAD
jgi:phage terminase small subunit